MNIKLIIILIVAAGYGCQKKNNSSAPIIVKQNGEITLYGKKTPLENLKLVLLDTLDKMTSIPDEIDIKYEGEVLMGMRGEIETEVADAISEAKAARQFARVDEQEPMDSGDSQDHPDLVAINDVIHDFYRWYTEFQNDKASEINFTRVKDNHLLLDMPKLEKYLSNIKASGYISDLLINNEIAALKKCEELWKNESLDEPPSCLDYDRFFCAQDWDINFWTQAPVAVEGLGTEKAKALMSSGGGENLHAQKFDLRKENGKWLITKIYCE